MTFQPTKELLEEYRKRPRKYKFYTLENYYNAKKTEESNWEGTAKESTIETRWAHG